MHLTWTEYSHLRNASSTGNCDIILVITITVPTYFQVLFLATRPASILPTVAMAAHMVEYTPLSLVFMANP